MMVMMITLTNIASLFTNYRIGIKFFYPILILFILTFIISVHSRKFKNKNNENIIKQVKLEIPDSEFIGDYTMLKNGSYEKYIKTMNDDVYAIKYIFKNFKILIKKYRKYDIKARTGIKYFRKHAAELRDNYLKEIIDNYEELKNIKMKVINDEVYKEWKQKQ